MPILQKKSARRRGGRNVSREVEKAWRMHDPWQGRVPYWVRCALHDFKDALSKEAAVIEAHLKGCVPSALIVDCIKRRGLARQRALQRLATTFGSAATVRGEKDAIEIRWLNSRDRLLLDPRDPGEDQPCTCVHFAVVWREPNGNVTFYANWLLEVANHALARLIQRAPTTDLRRCLFEAAACFAAADKDEVFANNRSFYLRSGPGAFSAELILGRIQSTGARAVYARARTFFTEPMLEPQQQPLAPAATPANSVATLLLSFARELDSRPSREAAPMPLQSSSHGIGANLCVQAAL